MKSFFLIRLLFGLACIFIGYRYLEYRFGCLFSNEWPSHIVDIPSVSSDSSLAWDPGYTFTPPLESKVNVKDLRSIPPILHQTYKSEQIPSKWAVPHQLCQKSLTNYTYLFWTDDSSRRFIESFYPWFLPTFDSYPYPIQRGASSPCFLVNEIPHESNKTADAIRYFALYHYGGFYVDLDIGCRRSFDPLRDPRYQVILPKTQPIGFSNDWMSSVPKHPFFGSLIFKLKDWNINLLTNYPTIFFSTGPMFLNMMYCQFDDKTSISILPDELYSGRSSSSFTSHYQGSSWHSWDAGIVFFVWKNWMQLLIGLCAMGGLFFFLLKARQRRIWEYKTVQDEEFKDV